MALTFGFYNSLNHDRLYDATQMSSLFDGIINDGVFESVGTQMTAKAGTGMQVIVGEGRAWFDHTWTLTDAEYPVEIPIAETVLDRIDALVLEVNSEADVRANDIKIVKGTPSSEPQKPTLINTTTVHQHPLAYITVNAGVTEITDAEIENMVGTSTTPFITGILETLDVDNLLTQWRAQFAQQIASDHLAFTTQQATDQANFESFFASKRTEFAQLYTDTQAETDQLIADIDAEMAAATARLQGEQTQFDNWFANLQNQLTTNQAANLQAQIDDIVRIGDAGIDAIFGH